jgi:hypothetical protein
MVYSTDLDKEIKMGVMSRLARVIAEDSRNDKRAVSACAVHNAFCAMRSTFEALTLASTAADVEAAVAKAQYYLAILAQ